MKHKIIKICFIAVSFFVVIFLINSCKKIGKNEPLQIDTKANETFLASIKADIEKNGMVQRVEVNQRFMPELLDLNGNIVPISSIQNFTSLCGGGNILTGENLLDYYEKQYQCNVGYKFKFSWTFSWTNNIVLVNPYNGLNKTKGTTRISVPGNANAYTDNTFDVQIVDMGLNPDQITYPDENLFNVTFTTATIVPESVLNTSGAQLKFSYFLASDCQDLTYTQVGFGLASAFNYTIPLNTNPCSRNEKLFVSMPSYNSGDFNYRKLQFAGFDPFSFCTYQYSCDPRYPDYQEVQYNVDGGAWLNASNTATYPSWITGSAFITRTNVQSYSALITPGLHTFQVRSRNWKFNTCPTASTIVPDASNSCFTTLWKVVSFPAFTVQ